MCHVLLIVLLENNIVVCNSFQDHLLTTEELQTILISITEHQQISEKWS